MGLSMGHRNKSLLERIEERVSRDNPNGCWNWTGQGSIDGYGYIDIRNKTYRAHRVAWEVYKGEEIPEGLQVCHKCDNRRCINPEHLFLGTNKDNHLDKVRKGRHAHGSRIGCSKLTETQVEEMRALHESGASYRQIGKLFGVHFATAGKAIRGSTWKRASGQSDTR